MPESGFPPWFKDLIGTLEVNSQAAREKTELKLAESRANHDAKSEAYCTLMLAHVARQQNDLPLAVRLSREAMTQAEPLGDDLLLFNTTYGHGLALRSSGNQAGGLEFLLRALQISERYPGSSGRARGTALAAIGATYHRLGDQPRAVESMKEALALAQKAGDEKAIIMYSGNLASYAEEAGDFAAARQGYLVELDFKRKAGNRTAIADVEESLFMLDFAEGRAEAALAAMQPILAQRRTLRGKMKLSVTLGNISEILLKLGRADEALLHLEEARPHVEAIESRGLRMRFYRRLAAVQEARGELGAALAATRREFAEKEAIAGEAAQSRAVELRAQFDVAKKDQELARLARANEVQTSEARLRNAQLAQTAAELRAKDAEVHAAQAELTGTRSSRLSLVAGAVAIAAVLGAMVVVQRVRIRAERRILEDTRAARDSAQQADALKSRLLGFASHDLKAPLATLSAATHLMEESAADPQEVKSLATAMRAEASRMVHLVHDFIDRAALETGRLELRTAPLDFAALAAHVAADFRPLAVQKNQVLRMGEQPSPLPLVVGEATRLEQVVANLLSNAINYTPRGGSIHVTLGHDDTGVWCEVRDTGPGIAPADQARLFQPFARLSARPTGGESSTGLGLYLAHELVRLHGGTLAVSSAPGAGASFRCTLPAAGATTTVV